ncbi:DNA sulfur modification protein DndC [Sphingobium sp. B8D3C]|nr:DNA sulfur modification protein DndC [Sphingobium sp. B8D3B]MCW2419386.1 DNA sulfur modification protein DndC [Sphingobium sp. B8D3C]
MIDAGELPQPEVLRVYYADTRQELPPIQASADRIIAKLRERNWIDVQTVRAPLDKRFMVYMLGRGIPPPNNGTLRWCTRQIKVDPMTSALAEAIEGAAGTTLMLTGVRQGESAVRDGRIAMSCSKDGAECGQGWYQQVLPESPGIRGRVATLAPLLHWRVCNIFDWLMIYAPLAEFGGWDTRILIDAYGGDDDARDIAARTGCIGCPLASEDIALGVIVAMPGWDHLRPLLELKPLYRELRKAKHRLRKAEPETLKDGTLSKSGQRGGPLKLESRLWALERVIDIQSRCNIEAERLGRPGVDILNAEEEARIRELIEARTWPQRWDGSEPSMDAWLDRIHSDGTVEPILFRELVGQ